jgi:hypothetical protein
VRWADPQRWQCALNAGSAFFHSISDCAEHFATLIENKELKLNDSQTWWLGNSLAWLLSTGEAYVRDGWVLAEQSSAKEAPRKTHHEDLLASILKVPIDKDWATKAASKCLRWLKPPEPRPQRHLAINERCATAPESHSLWVNQIQDQSAWPTQYDTTYHQQVTNRHAWLLGHARAHIGQGKWDAPFNQADWRWAVGKWDISRAVTPDLVPRSAFTTSAVGWQRAAWLTQRINGPSCLAIRPDMWRARVLATRHKKGPQSSNKSFRLIGVTCQHGLIQESILHSRLNLQVRMKLAGWQSGYAKDVADPMMVAQTLQASMTASGRVLLSVPADLVHAFPRTWRQDLLAKCHDVAEIKDGALALLGSILDHDTWLITHSGWSSTTVNQGVPEGGLIGPLLFNLLPDSLARELEDLQMGVGVGGSAPAEWQGHTWSGRGSPIPDLVDVLLAAIKNQMALPPAALLSQWADLEASAARALDLAAPLRVALLLHADDPRFLASSLGAMQATLDVVVRWAHRHKATLHCSSNKTVAQASFPTFCDHSIESSDGLVLRGPGIPSPLKLSWVQTHKWLGVQWTCAGNWNLLAQARIAAATADVAALAGLTRNKTIPISLALRMFDAKVEGSMRFSRWLWGASPELLTLADDAYNRWARTLLGAEPWRCGDVASAELGWHITGAGRCLIDVVAKRTTWWTASSSDPHALIFRMGHSLPGDTWSKLSAALLDTWGILDWPQWSNAPAGQNCSTSAYKKYVLEKVMAKCSVARCPSLSKHIIPVPYVPPPPCATTCGPLPFETQLQLRDFCRLRAGLLHLGHAGGHRTAAKSKQCVLCDSKVLNIYTHVLLLCPGVASEREAARNKAACLDSARAVLSTPPSHPAFQTVVALCSSVAEKEGAFWRRLAD